MALIVKNHVTKESGKGFVSFFILWVVVGLEVEGE